MFKPFTGMEIYNSGPCQVSILLSNAIFEAQNVLATNILKVLAAFPSGKAPREEMEKGENDWQAGMEGTCSNSFKKERCSTLDTEQAITHIDDNNTLSLIHI